MASRCEVLVDADPSALPLQDLRVLVDRAIAEVGRIEARFSRYRGDSIIGRINAAAGGAPVAIDAETDALLDFAQVMHDDSDGLFDITSGVLRRVWNFASGRPPSQREIDAVLPSIGWHKVERSPGQVRLPAGMELDFGGFGKEYAADRAASVLAAAGVAHALVNLGGDIRCLGAQRDGRPWQIAIRDPRHDDAVVASMPVTGAALATSGDYERFFEFEGRRYCHVIDPRTGWPVAAWASISVVAPAAIAAGATTTIALLRQGGAIPWLEASGLPWLAVRPDGAVLHSGA